MGSCIAKEKETASNLEPIVVVKKPKSIPSLSSIEDNQLYKTRVERDDFSTFAKLSDPVK